MKQAIINKLQEFSLPIRLKKHGYLVRMHEAKKPAKAILIL